MVIRSVVNLKIIVMSKEIVAKQPMVEEMALAKIKEYQDAGMVLPEGYNPTNSLKKARFILNDMKINGKPVLEVCTPSSIVQCLLESVAKGWDYASNQVYFIPRGNQMTNMESVYGRIVRAKRASRFYQPIVQYVHEGDVFKFGVDVETGLTKLFEHTTSLENLDKKIIAAYTYVTDNDGNTEVFIMTEREWLTSWKKSPNGCSVAKEYQRDMIFRTIIKKATKSLVNSATSTMVTSADDDDAPLADGVKAPIVEDLDASEYEELVENEPTPDVMVEPVANSTLDNEEF